MLFWQAKKDLNRVAGGKKVKLKCGKCNKQADFYECTVDDNLKLYLVLELWKDTKRVMQCGECLATTDYYVVFPQEKGLEEQRDAERKRDDDEARKKKMDEEESERRKQEMAENLARAERHKRMEAEVEDELAKLKRKLGK